MICKALYQLKSVGMMWRALSAELIMEMDSRVPKLIQMYTSESR